MRFTVPLCLKKMYPKSHEWHYKTLWKNFVEKQEIREHQLQPLLQKELDAKGTSSFILSYSLFITYLYLFITLSKLAHSCYEFHIILLYNLPLSIANIFSNENKASRY